MHTLPEFPGLDGISPRSRELVERTRQPFDFAPRETLIRIGERVDGTYFVTQGRLRAFIQDSSGHEKTLYHIGAGQTCILALNCSFSGVAYPAWVAAGEEPARGFTLPAATYRTLFDEERLVRDFTVNVLTSWIFDLMTWIEQTSLGSMAERLGRVLIRRADRQGVIRGTHHDLAADLGTAREVVSRHLKDFEELGLIRRGRQQIELLDRPRLLLRGGS